MIMKRLFQWSQKRMRTQNDDDLEFPTFETKTFESDDNDDDILATFDSIWSKITFAGLLGIPQKEFFTFWVSAQNAKSGVLVECLRKFIEESCPSGSCVYQTSSVFKWGSSSSTAFPYRIYKFNFFDSIEGLTPKAMADKLIQRMKEIEDIVKEYIET